MRATKMSKTPLPRVDFNKKKFLDIKSHFTSVVHIKHPKILIPSEISTYT